MEFKFPTTFFYFEKENYLEVSICNSPSSIKIQEFLEEKENAPILVKGEVNTIYAEDEKKY